MPEPVHLSTVKPAPNVGVVESLEALLADAKAGMAKFKILRDRLQWSSE